MTRIMDINIVPAAPVSKQHLIEFLGFKNPATGVMSCRGYCYGWERRGKRCNISRSCIARGAIDRIVLLTLDDSVESEMLSRAIKREIVNICCHYHRGGDVVVDELCFLIGEYRTRVLGWASAEEVVEGGKAAATKQVMAVEKAMNVDAVKTAMEETVAVVNDKIMAIKDEVETIQEKVFTDMGRYLDHVKLEDDIGVKTPNLEPEVSMKDKQPIMATHTKLNAMADELQTLQNELFANLDDYCRHFGLDHGLDADFFDRALKPETTSAINPETASAKTVINTGSAAEAESSTASKTTQQEWAELSELVAECLDWAKVGDSAGTKVSEDDGQAATKLRAHNQAIIAEIEDKASDDGIKIEHSDTDSATHSAVNKGHVVKTESEAAMSGEGIADQANASTAAMKSPSKSFTPFEDMLRKVWRYN